MIFITVGTTPFPFARMNRVFEHILTTRRHDEKIIYQHGSTPVKSTAKNIKLHSSLPFPKMEGYIKSARLIISHGGPATIYQCLSAGKKPFVLPRESPFDEHVNNHQLLFCKYLQEQDMLILLNIQNLQDIRLNSSKIRPRPSSAVNQLTKYLLKNTES